jgi:Protein of unknown function (DUF2911)
MRKRSTFFGILALLAAGSLALATYSYAQDDNGETLSPPAKAVCKFSDGKTITVNYASPRMRGRKIYGGLVPYGEVWRAGANDATTFVPNVNVVVGGKEVPAGSYTLFTLPSPAKWTLIISKQKGEWGIPYPGPRSDLLRADMRVEKLPSPVDKFTIGFDQTGVACTLRLDWEKTRAALEISEKK